MFSLIILFVHVFAREPVEPRAVAVSLSQSFDGLRGVIAAAHSPSRFPTVVPQRPAGFNRPVRREPDGASPGKSSPHRRLNTLGCDN